METRRGKQVVRWNARKHAILTDLKTKYEGNAYDTATCATSRTSTTLRASWMEGILVARIEGRSSLGRLGIIVHSTAGFVDPGFSGTITLEISNLNRLPVALYPGMRVCQIAFEQMSSPAEMPYHKKPGSRYQGQSLPEESRLSLDPEFANGNSL